MKEDDLNCVIAVVVVPVIAMRNAIGSVMSRKVWNAGKPRARAAVTSPFGTASNAALKTSV
ncbi:hypothetical protein BwSH20_77060 [Bradyrhizobium ottawaense]|nr:hypothetical protein BwSH12_76890 [Bradyrhizobium ottawaense]GMO11325.1 hypothetical protein BwSH20_77060 [Bradyrhizobium ottawaense]GMO51092.1 hypothetical protein BwSF21_73450 [Bradyrhizobium ottawaense]GMO54061.1 hypothetical protein BwSH14_77490 [Bradyrhizobium ottawaense]GMO60800.1 hypothetical protein BwSF12_77990 [Bradyrhizobium ottawaense]